MQKRALIKEDLDFAKRRLSLLELMLEDIEKHLLTCRCSDYLDYGSMTLGSHEYIYDPGRCSRERDDLVAKIKEAKERIGAIETMLSSPSAELARIA
jgi:hypothetical protein